MYIPRIPSLPLSLSLCFWLFESLSLSLPPANSRIVISRMLNSLFVKPGPRSSIWIWASAPAGSMLCPAEHRSVPKGLNV